MDFIRKVRVVYLSSRMCRGCPAGLDEHMCPGMGGWAVGTWEVTLHIQTRSWWCRDGTSGSGNAQHEVDVNGGERGWYRR